MSATPAPWYRDVPACDLRRAVAALPDRLRACAVLAYLREWPRAQIANELNIPRSALRRHLREVRVATQHHLSRTGVHRPHVPPALVTRSLMHFAGMT